MRRRELLAVVAGGAITWPVGTLAQQPIPVIGYLSSAGPVVGIERLTAFRDGLNQAGFVEGRSVTIEYRWAENHYDRLPVLAADLVGRQATLIAATGGGVSVRAAKAATATIPIVFVAGDVDPVKSGLVNSLNRPGGNITGITPLSSALAPKRLQMLRDLIPKAAVIGMLVNPNFADAEVQVREAREAAATLGLQLNIVNASDEADLDAAFATSAKKQAGALLVGNDELFFSRRERLAALAARYAIPAIYSYREYVTAGGLISYAPSLADAYRQAGIYAGKILQETSPADLPVMQPTKFELVVNLKTASALGLEVPPMLLDLADEVIE